MWHEEGPRARGAISNISRAGSPEGTAAGARTGGTTAVADGVRVAFDCAGLDPVPWGIRDHGPLDWMPADVPPTGPPEPPVAVARRRVLARQRLARIERDRWTARWFREIGSRA
jgi:hypothetical protein